MSIFENDFIMRQIEDLSNMIGKVFLHRQANEELHEEDFNDEKIKSYFRKIKKLIDEGQYKEAIRVLKAEFKTGNMEYLSIALSSFDILNALSETQLAMGGYSRNQLYNDLSFISEQFGIHL